MLTWPIYSSCFSARAAECLRGAGDDQHRREEIWRPGGPQPLGRQGSFSPPCPGLRETQLLVQKYPQTRIQDFGQGGPVWTPRGSLSQKLLKIGVFPENYLKTMIFKKSWGQWGQAPRAPWIR